jgi:hypothetical protein
MEKFISGIWMTLVEEDVVVVVVPACSIAAACSIGAGHAGPTFISIVRV